MLPFSRRPRKGSSIWQILLMLLMFNLACGFGGLLSEPEPTAEAPPSALDTPAATATVQLSENTLNPDGTPQLAPTPPPADTPSLDVSPDSRLPVASVVQIWTEDEFGDLLWSGSGSIVSPEGYILTNAHVVLSDKEYDVYGLQVWLTVAEDEPPVPAYRAETLVADESLDLAVLRLTTDLNGNPVNFAETPLPTVRLGNSDEVRLGTPIRILGYPGIGGETITLTGGEVAGFTSLPGVKGRAYIKTSATIAGGNSGGMAIDDDGFLIGVPTQLGYGGEDEDAEIVDCRVLADTNNDGFIDGDDACIPTGGFINALRPVNLAKPLIDQALSGEVTYQPPVDPSPPARDPVPETGNPGEVLFEDDFSVERSAWTLGAGISLGAGQNGQLTIRIDQASNYQWSLLEDQSFDSLDFQVQTEWLGGPIDNSFGQVFNYQDEENFYAFEISSDGFYALNKIEGGSWYSLIPWTASDLLTDTSTGHQLATVVQGNRYAFFIDGVQVDSYVDEVAWGGQIGLIASSYAEPDVAIAFDEVLVRVPGGPRQPLVTPADSLGGEVLLEDDFSTVDSGWNTDDSDDVEREIIAGAFNITVIPEQTNGWASYDGLVVNDVIINVTASKASGPDTNNFGILCRYQDAENFYFLQVGSDGTYAISLVEDGEETFLVDWARASAVQTGSASNRLRAECVGNQFRLYANDALLASVSDSTLRGGSIGLAAGTYDEGNVRLRFDDILVTAATPGTGQGSASELLFSEDFADNDYEWVEGDGDDSSVAVRDGEYVLRVNTAEWLAWSRTYDTWGAVRIELETRQISGPDDNQYGVICRYQDEDNFYTLNISGDGYYRIARWYEGDFESLVDWTRSEVIEQGASNNSLNVRCTPTELSLTVNGQELASVEDDLLPASGDVGMIVGTFEQGGAAIAFDDLRILAAE